MKMLNSVAGLGAIVTALLLPTPAEACGCGGGLPLSADVKGATTVFVGTVIEVSGGMPQPTVATFVVEKTYRGQTYLRTVISGDGTSCDITFVKDASYLVYAREGDGVLRAHKCTRTRSRSEATEDLRYLENLAAGTPQAILYGEVLEASILPDGTPAGKATAEPLTVVAERNGRRRSVRTDVWGPYQLVLAPGDYRLWVEWYDQPVTTPITVSLGAGEERRLQFIYDR